MYREIAVALFIVSSVVWLCAGYSAVGQLRAKSPDTYALVGSPKAIGLWCISFPSALDSLTLGSKFRSAGISDRQLLGTLEVVHFARWLQLIAVLAMIVGVPFASL